VYVYIRICGVCVIYKIIVCVRYIISIELFNNFTYGKLLTLCLETKKKVSFITIVKRFKFDCKYIE